MSFDNDQLLFDFESLQEMLQSLPFPVLQQKVELTVAHNQCYLWPNTTEMKKV